MGYVLQKPPVSFYRRGTRPAGVIKLPPSMDMEDLCIAAYERGERITLRQAIDELRRGHAPVEAKDVEMRSIRREPLPSEK